MSKALSFGRYIRVNDPALWVEVDRAEFSKAAVFTWSANQLSGVEFIGFRHTPCHMNGSSDRDHLMVHGPGHDSGRRYFELTTAAFQGVSRERVQIGYRCRKTIWWAYPARGDAPRLGALLTRARARWLDEPPPMPGPLACNEAYGALLVDEAAQTGDVAAMRSAIEHYGVDYDTEAYSGALDTAVRHGHTAFIRALVELVHIPDSELFAYCDAELYEFGVVPQPDREAVYTLLDAGFALPDWYRPIVARWICELGDQAPQRLRDEVLKLFLAGLPIPPECKAAVVAWAQHNPEFDAVLL